MCGCKTLIKSLKIDVCWSNLLDTTLLTMPLECTKQIVNCIVDWKASSSSQRAHAIFQLLWPLSCAISTLLHASLSAARPFLVDSHLYYQFGWWRHFTCKCSFFVLLFQINQEPDSKVLCAINLKLRQPESINLVTLKSSVFEFIYLRPYKFSF